METTTDKWGNVRCAECDRFVSASEAEAGRAIRHANYCESGNVEAPRAPARFVPRAVVQAAKAGAVAQVASDDEIVKLVRTGYLTNDDAMNRDG
jgi:hypothetical protein